jgi:hypothetical protein
VNIRTQNHNLDVASIGHLPSKTTLEYGFNVGEQASAICDVTVVMVCFRHRRKD